MTTEPATVAATLQAIGKALTTMWARGALFLWCVATTGLVVFTALLIGAHWQLGDTVVLLTNYGTGLALATLVTATIAAFKTYGEIRSERATRPVFLIPNERQSHWSQAKQPSGQIITAIALHFQATNVSDGAVKLSDNVRLRKPHVRKSDILQTLLHVRHHERNVYSSQYPVQAHCLTEGGIHIVIGHPVGTVGKPMHVVVEIQDHSGRCYKVAFPHVQGIGNNVSETPKHIAWQQ
jgi:hypothetical protein